MTEQTREEAVARLASLVKQAEAALMEAQAVATEHKLTFDFGPAYGMGGTFYGEPPKWAVDYHGVDPEGGWVSSSMGC